MGAAGRAIGPDGKVSVALLLIDIRLLYVQAFIYCFNFILILSFSLLNKSKRTESRKAVYNNVAKEEEKDNRDQPQE